LTTTHIAIKSLFNQTEMPDKIILWLAYDTDVPESIIDLTSLGLEIRYCKDYKSYKKLIPALTQFPNDILITVDDDVYYPPNWFSSLKQSYFNNPQKIHVNRAHEISINKNGELQCYKDWRFCVSKFDQEYLIFPTGSGGILYPPNSFYHDVLKSEIFMSLAPKGDDIWLWAMARLHGTKYYVLENGFRDLIDIDSQDKGMWIENIYQRGNDKQLVAIIEKYPKLLEILEKSLI
jgi:hypothetical protein